MHTFLAFLFLQATIAAAVSHIALNDQTQVANTLFDVKVPVQLGVMSRCPDALLCETTFNGVLEKIRDKIDLSLVYIAKVDRSEPVFGATCLHGPQECAGNVQQLCVAKYTSQEQWWNFVQCQNFQGKENVGSPEVALKCAGVAKFDWESSGVGQCAGLDGSGTGTEGVELLHESMRMVRELGIKSSCTILIHGRKVCIHDGTWKECENGHTVDDFVRQINEEYARLNSLDA